MTPAQLAALQRYVSATCAFMLLESTGREFLAAKAHLEIMFGKKLPPVDLFGEVPAPKPSGLPDLL